MVNVILYGAGGHGRVVADALATQPQMIAVGVLDDDPSRIGEPFGRLRVLGGSDMLADLRARDVVGAIVTIGHNQVRVEKGEQLLELGFELVTVVHSSAILAPDVTIGAGSVVMAGVVINAGTRVGRHVIVNTGATVDHECLLEDGCHVSPGANLAGNVRIGKEAHVGIGSSIVPGARIGDRSIVGAGAVVIRDVPADVTWVGNPARQIERSSQMGSHGRA